MKSVLGGSKQDKGLCMHGTCGRRLEAAVGGFMARVLRKKMYIFFFLFWWLRSENEQANQLLWWWWVNQFVYCFNRGVGLWGGVSGWIGDYACRKWGG